MNYVLVLRHITPCYVYAWCHPSLAFSCRNSRAFWKLPQFSLEMDSQKCRLWETLTQIAKIALLYFHPYLIHHPPMM